MAPARLGDPGRHPGRRHVEVRQVRSCSQCPDTDGARKGPLKWYAFAARYNADFVLCTAGAEGPLGAYTVYQNQFLGRLRLAVFRLNRSGLSRGRFGLSRGRFEPGPATQMH